MTCCHRCKRALPIPAIRDLPAPFPGMRTDSSRLRPLYSPFLSYLGNEVVGIGNIDLYDGLGDNVGSAPSTYTPCLQPGCIGPGRGGGEMLNNQLTSSSPGVPSASQTTTRCKPLCGSNSATELQFDLNYTYSRSIDITSSATRLGCSSSVNVGAPGTRLVNAFYPNGAPRVSDFDATHQFNANWIAELPLARAAILRATPDPA